MFEQAELLNYLEQEEFTQPSLPPHVSDLEKPHWARITNYYLEDERSDGDRFNWAVDREFTHDLLTNFPLDKELAVGHRSFAGRAVRYMAEQGVRQFLDVGSGSIDNYSVHHVVDAWSREQGRKPDISVCYVDHNSTAVAHSEVALDRYGDRRRQVMVEADLRHPYSLWKYALWQEVLDPEQPVGLLVTGTMQQEQRDAAGREIGAEALSQLAELMPAGSYLAVSHVTSEISSDPDECAKTATILDGIQRAYREAGVVNFVSRTVADIEGLLGDYEPVAPGWTKADEWGQGYIGPNVLQPLATLHPIWAGVGQKPATPLVVE